MTRSLLLAIAALVALPANARAATEVAVDAGALTSELVALLRFERPDVAFTSSTATATTRVSLKRDRELLSLAVLENGTPRIERVITVERERLKPALRVAALLVVEAIAPEPLAPIALPPSRTLTIAIAAGAELWIRPSTARFGPAITAHFLHFDQVSIGVRMASSGLVCCNPDAAQLHGTVRELALYADGAYELTTLGSNRLFAIGSAGINFAWYSGTATYAESSPELSKSAVEGAFRTGVAFELPPISASVRPVFSLGFRLRLRRMIVTIPVELRRSGFDFDPGAAAPFIEIGSAFDVL